jgi:hypothetical protein
MSRVADNPHRQLPRSRLLDSVVLIRASYVLGVTHSELRRRQIQMYEMATHVKVDCRNSSAFLQGN